MTSNSDNPGAMTDHSAWRKPMQFGLASLIGVVVVSAVVLAIFRLSVILGILGLLAGFIAAVFAFGSTRLLSRFFRHTMDLLLFLAVIAIMRWILSML